MSLDAAVTVRDARVALRAIDVVACALTLAGCDTLACINTFDKREK